MIPPNATGRSSNFYPRPLRGGRRFAEKSMFTRSYFYPRPLRGGRRKHAAHGSADTDFYPRPLRGGRPFNRRQRAGHNPLFLSTPSARRATPSCPLRCPCRSAFLSTPSARRATRLTHCYLIMTQFLSTPSARRATGRSRPIRPLIIDFYPRPLRGGRLLPQCRLLPPFCISIHALCEEGDWPRIVFAHKPLISIHALCEEGDITGW